MRSKLSRRKFLVSTGWVAAGATIVFSTTGCSLLPILPTSSDDAENDAQSWIQMMDDGKVRFYMGKAEMGQGIMTGLSQIMADQLKLPLSQIKAVLPSSLQINPISMTVGSESIELLYQPLSLAAAQLREKIKKKASKKFNVLPSNMKSVVMGFQMKNSGRFLSYSQIMGSEAKSVTDQKPPIIDKSSTGRLDVKDKVTGKAQYSREMTVSNMLHGKTLYPPVFGARLESVDDREAKKVSGVVAIVKNIQNNFAGVVADTEHTAQKALDKLQVRWNSPKLWQQEEIDDLLDPVSLKKKGTSPHKVYSDGDWEEGKQLAEKTILQRSYTPFGTHAPMETWAAVVSVSADKVEAWVGSQDLFFHQAQLADICNISKDNVEVHGTYLGGGFGGKVGVLAAFEAARLSMAVKRPVSVRWSREQQFQASYHRSAVKHQIEAGVDKEGKVCFFKHEIGSGPVIFNPLLLSKTLQWGTSFVTDFGGTRGALNPYTFANKELHFWDETLPVPCGAWRGLGATTNTYAIETAIDQLAKLADKDPLSFRLENLGAKSLRLQAVLKLAAAKGGWGQKLPPNWGHGIAAMAYKDKTFVAVMAIVSIKDKFIKVEKLICAHDCGLIISRDSVKSQIEGNLIWGLGMATKEQLEVRDGKFGGKNFDSYPILRAHEIPEIETHLIEDKTIAPSGAGEAAIAPTPAAICNAIFSITGNVIDSLPIPEEIT